MTPCLTRRVHTRPACHTSAPSLAISSVTISRRIAGFTGLVRITPSSFSGDGSSCLAMLQGRLRGVSRRRPGSHAVSARTLGGGPSLLVTYDINRRKSLSAAYPPSRGHRHALPLGDGHCPGRCASPRACDAGALLAGPSPWFPGSFQLRHLIPGARRDGGAYCALGGEEGGLPAGCRCGGDAPGMARRERCRGR